MNINVEYTILMGSNIKKVYIKLFMETNTEGMINANRDISAKFFFSADSHPIFILKILRASTLGGKNSFSSDPGEVRNGAWPLTQESGRN